MSPSDGHDGHDVGRPTSATSRERSVADTFVSLADTLVEDYDVVDLLTRLAHACVDLLDVSAAGLLLDDQRGSLGVVASSTDEARLLNVFQVQTDEGPCLDCIRTAAPVMSGDLAADKVRWPRFAPAALTAGLRSVTALPLRLRGQTIGGLNLFRTTPDPVSEEDRRLAQAFADVATIGILQQRTSHRQVVLAEQLQRALNDRVVIEQAKGVLAERHGLGMDAAFDNLRTHARTHRVKLTDVARAVTRGEILGDLRP